MDFEVTYSEEQQRFRAEVRAWFEANVPSELAKRPASAEENYQQYLLRRELGRRLGAKGWNYPLAPKEYGGGGLDVDHAIILEEEADRLGLSLPPYYDSGGRLGAPSILVWGTEEQKRAFLPPIYTGEVRTWQLLTEPGAGSDLAGVRMAAVRDGDEYVLNGQKIYVGSDNGADRIWIIACTDPNAPRHENVSWFMIDASLPGITVQPMDLLGTGGEGGADSGQKQIVFFDDVRVPAFSLVGGENNGWRVASTHLELEHGGGGRIGRNRLWERLFAYCQETERDGEPLIKDQDVRDTLAEIYIKSEVGRLFGLRNFWLTYARRPRSYEGPQLSMYRKLAGLWMTGAILEAVGPAALTTDETWGSPDGFLENQQRNGIVAVHPGGTVDIQKISMARRIGIGRATRSGPGRSHRRGRPRAPAHRGARGHLMTRRGGARAPAAGGLPGPRQHRAEAARPRRTRPVEPGGRPNAAVGFGARRPLSPRFATRTENTLHGPLPRKPAAPSAMQPAISWSGRLRKRRSCRCLRRRRLPAARGGRGAARLARHAHPARVRRRPAPRSPTRPCCSRAGEGAGCRTAFSSGVLGALTVLEAGSESSAAPSCRPSPPVVVSSRSPSSSRTAHGGPEAYGWPPPAAVTPTFLSGTKLFVERRRGGNGPDRGGTHRAGGGGHQPPAGGQARPRRGGAATGRFPRLAGGGALRQCGRPGCTCSAPRTATGWTALARALA
ncbi:MAG: acyl-CoA dehydrogenase family protein [Dehalococcoidia bacterium]